MKPFDIAPFGLPRCAAGEVRFEQPRDLCRVRVGFKGRAPADAGLSYLQKTWPQSRPEWPANLARTNPCVFGWRPIDDAFNSEWKPAAARVQRADAHTLEFVFEGVHAEFADFEGREDYNVTFRRTLGVRVDVPRPADIARIEVYTTSLPAKTVLRVELDAGAATPGRTVVLSGYNIRNLRVVPLEGCRGARQELRLSAPGGPRAFRVSVEHMQPAHSWTDDDGHVTFALEKETFTVSLSALQTQGPVWFAEQGVYLALAGDATTFAQYRERRRDEKTVGRRVAEAPEQSLAGAFHGQPRPHAVAYTIGWKHARQRFRIEPNGDVVLVKWNVTCVPGRDTPRFFNDRDGRFFFELGDWIPAARFTDPLPAFAYNQHFKQGGLFLEQKCLAVPLFRPASGAELQGDDPVVALVRFRVRNLSDRPATARIPVGYSADSVRSRERLAIGPLEATRRDFDDHLAPRSPREVLRTEPDGRITGAWQGRSVLRAAYASDLVPAPAAGGLVFEGRLKPGETAELLLKIPFVAPEAGRAEKALRALGFGACEKLSRQFWAREAERGARVATPSAHLDALHAMHPLHVQVTDFSMPGKRRLINTSVGSSTYGNFLNEACMIIQDLDQRGLHDEARRRIEVWLEYQGTVGLKGLFSDHEGVFFGAGGFESGFYYCQHHGWALWIIAQHYNLTGDSAWLGRVADRLVAGADWVFRQRRLTMEALPHSRGWERGFLPAGGLEDVGDYCYWLSTNALTWRGCDAAAAALEAIRHPQAGRVRRNADAYRRDLVRGFETQRRHTPLVRLRDGRWVPHYPSRLYCRGRDSGWIRETLEGSVYLLLSGLYAPDSPQAGWILDDFQDNRYLNPPFGYALDLPEQAWFDRGGLSIQPNLLAGLLPHLDRDEIEVFLWMFFNCWNACYREEITAMVEHPFPALGFSNSAQFKTSDEANAVMWLRSMFVYTRGEALHIGRAIPRDWLRAGQAIRAENVVTRFGTVSVAYESAAGRIRAAVRLDLRRAPSRILVRFRTPGKQPLKSVMLNGRPHPAFSPESGDVDVTGRQGELGIEAEY